MFPTLSTLSRNSVVAGMPNIVGELNLAYLAFESANGCFTASGSSGDHIEPWDIYRNRYANFDASRSSSIYGNSITVTPLSLSCKIILKY